MVTFTTLIGAQRQDGTRNVRIRVTANRTNTSVGTSIYVTSQQLTRSGKIRDQRIIDACDNIIREWRAIVSEIGSIANTLNAREVVDYIRKYNRHNGAFSLDFIGWMREYAESKSGSTAHNYRVAATSLERYIAGRKLDVNELTAQILSAYEQWLHSEGIAKGTIVVYMSLIKAAHNAARYKYNDEDAGVVRISRTPFVKYKIPQAPAPSGRGIDRDTLQAIANLADDKRVNSARNLTRDLFLLSFALGGMNYADMWSLPYSALHSNYIEYRRQKTRNARTDGALYRVYIVPEIMPLVELYLDPAKKRLFRFYQRYSAYSFAVTIARSMKALETAVPTERHYTFYAARHTYASLARNVVGLDKYTVHELLNHSDAEMRITDRYIERDWQRLFDAHAKIVRLVDWLPLNLRLNK